MIRVRSGTAPWGVLLVLLLAGCDRGCPDGQIRGADDTCHACDPASYGVALELRPFFDEQAWADERVAATVAAELKKREPFVPSDPLAAAGAASGGFPKNTLVLPGPNGPDGKPGAWHLLGAESLLLDPNLTAATVGHHGGLHQVRLDVDEAGSRALLALTKANVGQRLGMISRGRVQATPVVREPISGAVSVAVPTAADAVSLACAARYAMVSRDAGAPLN